MNDTQILDWVSMCVYEIGKNEHNVHNNSCYILWINFSGEKKFVSGYDLRDCVRGALAGEGMPGVKL